MDVEAEMPGLNAAADAGFFAGFAFRRLAGRDDSGSPLGNVHLPPPFVFTSMNSTEGPRRR
jgi:hypothetical protein